MTQADDSRTFLVTGDSGFIGTYLARRLMQTGYSVKGIDVLPHYSSWTVHPQIVGNILEPEAVRRTLRDVQCIIHLAAEHKDFGVSHSRYFQVNKDGTENLLRCAAEQDVKEFIFFSSVAVYGEQQATSEDTAPNPITPYGESKLAAENAVRQWTKEDLSRTGIIIRPTVVFGPMNNANIFRLIKQVCDGRFVWVGNGDQIKSVAYVENLVDATLFLLQNVKPGLEVFNYADSPHLRTRELVNLIASKAGVRIPSLHIPATVAVSAAKIFDLIGAISGRDFSLTSLRIKKFSTPTYHTAEKIRRCGFTPSYTIEEGIEKNVQWYLNHYRSMNTSFEISE